MKLRIISDLHLEFHDWKYSFAGEDCMVIAGDTCSKNADYRLHNLLEDINSYDIPVIMCGGNHDYFNCTYNNRLIELRGLNDKYTNIHFLENETFDFKNYRFLVTALWTDFNLYGNQPIGMFDASRSIADFSLIHYGDEKTGKLRHLTPENALEFNKLARKFLEIELANCEKDGKTPIVVTHWQPTDEFTTPEYKNNLLNPYFTTSNVQEFFDPSLPVWVFGHGHSKLVDKVFCGTRFIKNTRGYPSEHTKSFNDKFIIEI